LKLHIEQVQQQADDIYKSGVRKQEENEDLKRKLTSISKQQNSSKRVDDLEKKIKEMQASHRREVEQLKKLFESEKDRLMAQISELSITLKNTR